MPHSCADMPLAAVATALVIYPVKACAGVEVKALEIDARGGAAGDRRWAVIDAEGAVTWLGSHPRLAFVTPRFLASDGAGRPTSAGGVDDAGHRLQLGAPGIAPIYAPPAALLRPCTVKIWSDLVRAHEVFDAADAGDAVAAWLEAVTGAPLRLVRLGDAAVAREGPGALHLVFADSVAAVDAQLAAEGHPPADLRRYRPNVVLAGQGAALAPFIEDSLETIAWSGHGRVSTLTVTSLCVRCIVPNVDPSNASVSDATQHALATLGQRRRPGDSISFGIYARAEPGTRLALRDTAALAIAF
jgi:uncharacterized protein YcbX